MEKPLESYTVGFEAAEPLDTLNRFLVTASGPFVVQQLHKSMMTREEALQLASWLIAMADCVSAGPVTAIEIVQATVREIQRI